MLQDIKELELDVNLENIKQMKKVKLKSILNIAVKSKALKNLNRIKQNHSKGKELEYSYLEMQRYLKPSQINKTHKDAITIFRLRTRMTNVKANFKGKYDNLSCEICMLENETQQHILKCEKIDKEISPEYNEIFGENVEKQVKIAKVFKEKIKIRNRILEIV